MAQKIMLSRYLVTIILIVLFVFVNKANTGDKVMDSQDKKSESVLTFRQKIKSVNDWYKFAPPKGGDKQWKSGRSAKELATAWFPSNKGSEVPSMPPEFKALLESKDEISNFELDFAEPEWITKIDNFRGGQRNSDLVIWGRNKDEKLLISVEAKADETFDKISKEYVNTSDPKSNIGKRIKQLISNLFGEGEWDKAINLRYQLLTGVTGTLIEANKYGATKAIFVVHEFTAKTDKRNLLRNQNDLDAFVKLLSGGDKNKIIAGELLGPFKVPFGEKALPQIELYIGKCSR